MQFNAIIYTWAGAHDMHVSPIKVMGVNFPDNVSDSLANHNTPAQTNHSEPTACRKSTARSGDRERGLQ